MMTIQCVQNSCATDFLNKNEDHLLQTESINNLILGLTDSIIRNRRKIENPLFFTILNDSKVIGQAILTDRGKPFAISDLDKDALGVLASKLIDMDLDLTGVVGPKDSSSTFSEIWCKLCNVKSELEMHQGIYELTEVNSPDYGGGNMLLATTKHQDIVFNYILGFINDCFPNEKKPFERAKEMACRHIQNGSVFLWKNASGKIVSMASNNRTSKNAATLSLVYTPRELRGKGHASQIVAMLSQKLLSDGKTRCNLYTDLTNPISNSIYQKIGYKFLGESMHFNFI